MTDERDLIRGMAEAWTERGIDAWLEFIHPDCVMHPDPEWPDAGVVDGKAALEHFARDFADQWGALELGAGDIEQRGDRWIAETRWVATGRSSGVDTDLPFFSVITVRDGLLAEMWLVRTREAALAAADAAASDSG